MRPIDKTTARHHTDLSEERYRVDGRSKRLTKRLAKRKSSKAYRRALTKRTLREETAESSVDAKAGAVLHRIDDGPRGRHS